MPCRRVAVAVSGGRDSMALLHATVQAARECGAEVVALHVHHGLLPQADGWLERLQAHCEAQAAQGLPLSLRARRLQAAPAPGESVEAWARRGRYAALTEMARDAGATLVLLAHHRRDQAETVLLQALRGGGAAGLSAMPRWVERDGLQWVRPWLDMPREAVEAYVRHHGLWHVEDPSNAQPRFARNRLRLQVWPALHQAFADAESALAATACRAQLEAAALQELAAIDLVQVVEQGGALLLGPWAALSPARRANVLRAWLHRTCGQRPSQTLLLRLLDELLASAAPARWPAGGLELRRYRGRLQAAAGPAAHGPPPAEVSLSIMVPGVIAVPAWRGRLEVSLTEQGGVPLWRLAAARLRVRTGGEQFQRVPGGVARSLKKQFQAAGLAAWERAGPLLFCGEHLVFVPGLGVDALALAPPGVVQVSLRWQADPWPPGGSRGG